MGKYQYTGYYPDTGQAATETGPKRLIEAMAVLLSSKRFGSGRKVCIQRIDQRDLRAPQKVVSCWVNGRRRRSKSL